LSRRSDLIADSSVICFLVHTGDALESLAAIAQFRAAQAFSQCVNGSLKGSLFLLDVCQENLDYRILGRTGSHIDA
jgi:hypothetical protein